MKANTDYEKSMVLFSKASKQREGFHVSRELTRSTVASILAPDGKAYINKGGPQQMINYSKFPHVNLVPHISLSAERNCIVISGKSGSGKSMTASILANQYNEIFPENEVWLISSNQKHDDENFVDLDFIGQLESEYFASFKCEEYRDSLFIIDDCDNSKHSKLIFAIINDIVERGRKFGISLIFITHLKSKMQSSPIYSDCTMYIAFPGNVYPNRSLEHHLNIPKQKLMALSSMPCSFFAFDIENGSLITNKFVDKL